MIEIKNVSYKYPGSGHQVFEDFSLNVEADKIYGLLGKNGTGKSTLLYLISGLLRPKRGSIIVNGHEARLRKPDMLSEMFLVPEEFDLMSTTLDSYVKIHEVFYPRFSRAILESCLGDFDLSYDINLKELSMGQKKKVYMSLALATNTRLLLMDEPTNGLDIPSKSQFRKVVANNMDDGRAMIISTHQVHDIESLLDHIMILDGSSLPLDAAVSEICDKYRFSFRKPGESVDDALYAEPAIQGTAVITRRQAGEEETPLNLEMLFNAITSKSMTF